MVANSRPSCFSLLYVRIQVCVTMPDSYSPFSKIVFIVPTFFVMLYSLPFYPPVLQVYLLLLEFFTFDSLMTHSGHWLEFRSWREKYQRLWPSTPGHELLFDLKLASLNGWWGKGTCCQAQPSGFGPWDPCLWKRTDSHKCRHNGYPPPMPTHNWT